MRAIPVVLFCLIAGMPVARAQICTATASLVAFGLYDTNAARPTDSIGTVTVTCTGPPTAVVAYQIKLVGAGTGRHLGGSGASVVYQLYADAARTQVWGDCTGGTSCVSDSYVLGQASAHRSYMVYCRIPPHQRVAPGSFLDQVMVLLSY